MIIRTIAFMSSLFTKIVIAEFKLSYSFITMVYHNLPFIGIDDDDKEGDDDKKNVGNKDGFGSKIGSNIKNIFLYQSRKLNAQYVHTWRHRICGILYLCLKLPYWIVNNIRWFIEHPIDPDLFLLTINPIYSALKPVLKELKEDVSSSFHTLEDDTMKIITSTEQLAMVEITKLIGMTKEAIKKNSALLDKLDLPLLYIIDEFLEFFSPIDISAVTDTEIEKMWGDAYKNHKEIVSLLTKIFMTLEKIRDKKTAKIVELK